MKFCYYQPKEFSTDIVIQILSTGFLHIPIHSFLFVNLSTERAKLQLVLVHTTVSYLFKPEIGHNVNA